MIKIIADSTCDLPEELIQKYGIYILPLHIHLGDNEYEDGLTITPKEIFEWSDNNMMTPKTSAISLMHAMEIMGLYVKQGYEIICFSISNAMSSSGEIMRMAAEELEIEKSVHVVNSQNLCGGISLLIMKAAQLVEERKSAEEIVDIVERMVPRVRSSFIVDTLTYLYRGGRCSGIEALVGSVMKLHPKIVVENGKMHATKKYRGKIESSIMVYTKDMEEEYFHADSERMFIAYAGCEQQIVENVYQYVKSLNIFEDIIIIEAGGVISSHCGPETVGIFYLMK